MISRKRGENHSINFPGRDVTADTLIYDLYIYAQDDNSLRVRPSLSLSCTNQISINNHLWVILQLHSERQRIMDKKKHLQGFKGSRACF